MRWHRFINGQGEFITLVGPSGCGKSTLFNLAAGFLKPSRGSVTLNDCTMHGTNPYVAYMFQHHGLLDWRTTVENVMLGQEFLGRSRKRARLEALEWLDHFGLGAFAYSRPWELSGGMKQRVALLRTYLTHRELLLLDEPFGAVDALTRLEMQQFLLDTWEQERRTVIFITHDVEEALLLGDRVLVVTPRPGTVREIVEVNFPRPRRTEQLLRDANFVEEKARLIQLLHGS